MAVKNSYEILCEKLGYPNSVKLRRVLEKLLPGDEADIAAMLPKEADEIARELGITGNEVNEKIKWMCTKGVIVSVAKGNFFPRGIHQIRNASAASPKTDDVLMPELADLWEEFSQAEWYTSLVRGAEKRYEVTGKPGSRVTPARLALEGANDIAPAEDVKAWIESAEKIAVSLCPCRRQSKGRCDHMVDTCMQFNKAAEYVVARGAGHYLPKEEAWEHYKKMEEDGLIHLTGYDADFVSQCNCCTDCCQSFYPLISHGKLKEGMQKSRYEARVDVESCDGCQICIERCPFDAIDLIKVPSSKKMKATVDPEKCWGCGVCVVGCPISVISFPRVRDDDFFTTLFPKLDMSGGFEISDSHEH